MDAERRAVSWEIEAEGREKWTLTSPPPTRSIPEAAAARDPDAANTQVPR